MATSTSAVEKNSPPAPLEIVIPDPNGEASASASAVDLKANNGTHHRKMMTNLTKRPPAQIEYSELVYTVRERSGKWFGGVVPQTKQILHGESNCIEREYFNFNSFAQF